MSASRDKTQKIQFVYANLYEVFRKGKEAAQAAEGLRPGLRTGAVLKAGELLANDPVGVVKVKDYHPAQLAAPAAHRRQDAGAVRPITRPKPAALREQDEAIASLRQNLKTLNDLHSRLRFMLQELEELVKA